MLIRDTYTRGIYAGLVGSLPALALDLVAVGSGLSSYYGFQLTGAIFLKPGLTDWAAGVVLGLILWFGVGAFLGVAVSYLLIWTGHDGWPIKGISLSLVAVYMLLYGVISAMGASTIVPFDLATNFTQLIENVITGFSVACLTVRWSPSSLQS